MRNCPKIYNKITKKNKYYSQLRNKQQSVRPTRSTVDLIFAIILFSIIMPMTGELLGKSQWPATVLGPGLPALNAARITPRPLQEKHTYLGRTY